MYFRRKQSTGPRIYLQIVESHRSGEQVRQRVIATLGRLDELEASGQLDRLLRSGARFVRPRQWSWMPHAIKRRGSTGNGGTHRPAPAVRATVARDWLPDVITGLARKRGHRFALERVVFLTVLHRLMVWFGSGRRSLARGLSHHRHRRSRPAPPLPRHGLAGEELPPSNRTATPFSPRCTKDLIEEPLFAHRRDLLSGSTWCSWTPPAST